MEPVTIYTNPLFDEEPGSNRINEMEPILYTNPLFDEEPVRATTVKALATIAAEA